MSHAAAERVARESYGRLVAWLSSHTGDLRLAEDALGDALVAALQTWPDKGVPNRPEAWLLTAARRRAVDRVRRHKTTVDKLDAVRRSAEELAQTPFRDAFPDRRVDLLFLCAHPEIPARDRTPLMLQVALGLDAKRIAGAFLTRPATMSQRLVGTKRTISELGLTLQLPGDLGERMPAVLDAIYAAFTCGQDDDTHDLAEEALWLAQVVVRAFPDHAEALALYSLLCSTHGRRRARVVDGLFVPLPQQDVSLWDHDLLDEAEVALRRALPKAHAGRYQVEAAIASMHGDMRRTGTVDWPVIRGMYAVLVELVPTVGARVGFAAATLQAGDPDQALAILDALDAELVARHQPYWAVRAHVLTSLGRDAASARRQAIGLSKDPAVRRYLEAQGTNSDGPQSTGAVRVTP